MGKHTHKDLVSIKGDRFGKDGRIKEEVLITFNPVKGTLFLGIEGAKIDRQYAMPLEKAQEKLLPLLLPKGFALVQIGPIETLEERMAEAGEWRPKGHITNEQFAESVQIAAETDQVLRAPIIPPGPGRPGGPEPYDPQPCA